MAYPLINPYQQFFDSSGAPLASGTIEFRDPVTDNLINSYPTADDADAQTNANANPLTLSATGAASTGLYLEDGVKYKVVLKDSSGATVTTQDDVRCPLYSQASIGAAFYPESAAETAAGITPTNYQYKVGNVLRYGADATGATSSTTAFAAVLEAGGFSVYIPTGTYEVDPSAWDATDQILIGSNTTIYCEPGVTVRIPTGGGTTNLGWMRFRDVTNCAVYGNNSIWEYETKPTSDEQRHIWDIRGSSDIVLRDLIAKKAGGDGFYIGAGSVNELSTNITLDNCHADNCRRQGLSIVSVQGCWVRGGSFKNITGTAPQYGIDIEPNDNTDTIEGIVIDGVYTENCDGLGIGIALQGLPGATAKHVSIKIINCHDNASDYGFRIRGGVKSTGEYDGTVEFINCSARDNNLFGLVINNWPADGPQAYFSGLSIFNNNEAATANDANGSAIFMDDDSTQDMGFVGNITFHNTTIEDNRATPNITNYYYIRAVQSDAAWKHTGANNASVLTDSTRSWPVDGLIGMKITNATDGSSGIITDNDATTVTATLAGGTDNDWDANDLYVIGQNIKDVHITGLQRLTGQSTGGDQIYFDGAGSVEDIPRHLVHSATGSYTFGVNNYTRHVDNTGASGTVAVTLDDLPPDFPMITFEVTAAQTLRIDPDSGSHIYPGSNGAGKYIQSNNIGDRLTIRRKSRTEWFITEEVGTWTREV